MAGLLPEPVLQRKKRPYPTTHHPAYLAAVAGMLGDVLSDRTAPVFQLVQRQALEKLLRGESEDRSNVPWYGQLMIRPQIISCFLQLNHWLEFYRVKLV